MPVKEELEEAISTDGITVSGAYPTLERCRTGLFSLDYALANLARGELGLPMRNIVMLSGYQGIGKSTLAYYLAGKAAKEGTISVCDLEMLDRNYIPFAVATSGFKGDIRLVDSYDEKQRPIPHESMMMNMAASLASEEVGASVMDSVSAIQPIAEAAGDFGEAFMGKRAKLVAQVARALSNALRNKERASSAFVINHAYQVIGGHGHTTAGGIVLPALCGVIVHMWTKEVFMSGEKDDPENRPLGFLVGGQVEKLRFGGKGRMFQFYIVPGFGVHPGVTAMFDAFAYGFAERGSRVKMNDKSFGYLKSDLLTYAAEGKSRKFTPFVDALRGYADDIEKGNVDDGVSEDQTQP
jgi:RecA/RadA recombinase